MVTLCCIVVPYRVSPPIVCGMVHVRAGWMLTRLFKIQRGFAEFLGHACVRDGGMPQGHSDRRRAERTERMRVSRHMGSTGNAASSAITTRPLLATSHAKQQQREVM